jgi:hypothetical protein
MQCVLLFFLFYMAGCVSLLSFLHVR